MAAMAHKKTYENLITAVAEYALVKPLKVFGVSIAFDETKERLSLPLDVLATAATSKSSWNCLVSNERIAWHLGSEVASEMSDVVATLPRWSQLEMLRPLVPIPNTKGEGMHDGIYCAPQLEDQNRNVANCLARTEVGFQHFDRDGAGACARVTAHKMIRASVHVLSSDMECGNHHNGLVEQSSMAATDARIIPFLYSTSLFIGIGGGTRGSIGTRGAPRRPPTFPTASSGPSASSCSGSLCRSACLCRAELEELSGRVAKRLWECTRRSCTSK